MKKIFLFLFTIFTIFLFSNIVNAETFKEGTYISGDYIKKEKNGVVKYKQSRFILRSSDNSFVYCIEPFEKLDVNSSYDDLEYINHLSDEVLQKMSLLAHYGYGYENHSDQKWYSITQVMIQRLADNNSSIYFTDKLNGTKIEKYENEMKELNLLVDSHFIKPSFNNKIIKILKGDTIVINDENNVFNKYEFINNSNIFKIEKNNNTLNVTANDVGQETINFSKTYDKNNPPIVYKSLYSQNIISKGSPIDVFANIKLESFTGEINLNKFDSDNKSCKNQGEANLKGSIYSIYDSNNKLIKDIEINENCEGKITGLNAGTYYIKEKKAGIGYEKDEKIYEVKLDSNNPSKTLTLYDKVIKTEIIINKYYGNKNKGIYQKEKNALFNVIDFNNNIIGTIKTNNYGIGKIILPYGKYTIKQISGIKNYQKTNDIKINVNSFLGKKVYYNLYNNEKVFKIKLYKIDRQTNKLIKNNYATFVIKNNDTNSFILNSNNTIYFKTNKNGILEIDNLSIGNYTIYEIKSPNGFYLNEEKINFSVSENDIDNANNNYIYEIKFFNDKIVKAPNTNINNEKKDGINLIPILFSGIFISFLIYRFNKN